LRDVAGLRRSPEMAMLIQSHQITQARKKIHNRRPKPAAKPAAGA
jgi:hypothetical protein